MTSGFCIEGRYKFDIIHSFKFCIQGCDDNSECRSGEVCDKSTKTCRKKCEEEKDCNGSNQTCDKSRGFCVDGEIRL